MGNERKSASKESLRSAIMKLQLGALLLISILLHSSLPVESRILDISHSGNQLIPMDRFAEASNYVKRSGRSAQFRSRRRGVGISDFPYNFDYLTRFSLGTPPREFTGYLDTGSDVVWVQCDPCKDCVSQVALFETNTSTSYETLPCSSNACIYINETGGGLTNCTTTSHCGYQLKYGTGEATGELSADVLTLNSMGQNDTYPNFVFGCTNQDGEGAFPIVALSRSRASLVGQLGPKVGTAFSFCFSTYTENKTTEFTLGSRGTRDLTYTPLLTTDQTLYYVNLTGISVNGTLLAISPGTFTLRPDGSGGIILDTGSTLTTLSSLAYDPLRVAIESLVTFPTGDGSDLFGLDLCYNVAELGATSLDQLGFPRVTFHFQDLVLELPVENTYIFNGDNTAITLVCLAMVPDPSNSENIFGNYQMQNHYYFFDPDNSRVGMKSKRC